MLWSLRTGTMPYQPAERATHTDCPHGPEAAGCKPAHWIPVPSPQSGSLNPKGWLRGCGVGAGEKDRPRGWESAVPDTGKIGF